MYIILLFLGLGIGAVFLGVLLIGDRKEARLESRKRMVQEQMAQAREPVDGAWPPPPNIPALPDFSPYAVPLKPRPTRVSNRTLVRGFFLLRNYAASVLILAYIVYSLFPRLPFGWVLGATALAALAVWGVLALWKRRAQN